jgi:CheY-like chemotaxis protein
MWNTPRQSERVPVSLEIVLEFASGSGKRDARISDLSMGGCFVDSIAQVSEGETVALQVHLPMGLWAQLYGEVVYCSPGFGFGLRFTRLAEEERILLEQVITAHGGKPSPPPDATGAAKTEPPAPTLRAQTSQGNRRVLIADDDPTIRHLTQAILHKEGYAAIMARDGREAHDLLQTDADYVAAIFDMVMPHVQGLELVRYMRAEKRLQHIPVGIITAEQDPKLWNESFAAGAVVFLPKPFTPEQMRYMLKVLVSQARPEGDAVR